MQEARGTRRGLRGFVAGLYGPMMTNGSTDQVLSQLVPQVALILTKLNSEHQSFGVHVIGVVPQVVVLLPLAPDF